MYRSTSSLNRSKKSRFYKTEQQFTYNSSRNEKKSTKKYYQSPYIEISKKAILSGIPIPDKSLSGNPLSESKVINNMVPLLIHLLVKLNGYVHT